MAFSRPGFGGVQLPRGSLFQPAGFEMRRKWVGSRVKFNPDHGTVPMSAGSFFTHTGK